MEEQLISFETAKLAKEKGFDIICQKGFNPNNGNIIEGNLWFVLNTLESNYHIQCPTQSLLQRWLREVHNIHIELLIDGWGLDDNCVSEEFLCYRAFIWQVGKPKPLCTGDYGAAKYEKILEFALHGALLEIEN